MNHIENPLLSEVQIRLVPHETSTRKLDGKPLKITPISFSQAVLH